MINDVLLFFTQMEVEKYPNPRIDIKEELKEEDNTEEFTKFDIEIKEELFEYDIETEGECNTQKLEEFSREIEKVCSTENIVSEFSVTKFRNKENSSNQKGSGEEIHHKNVANCEESSSDDILSGDKP